MQVAIAGGGIGGMALALSLVEAGIEDVDVYESAAAEAWSRPAMWRRRLEGGGQIPAERRSDEMSVRQLDPRWVISNQHAGYVTRKYQT